MIDLHIHSMFSDGTDTIENVIEIAKNKRMPVFSLTDHDTTLGVKDIIEKASIQNIRVVPGVEISSVSNGHLLHILGYNIDIENSQLQDMLSEISNYYNQCFYEHYNWLYKNNIVNFPIEKIIDYAAYKQSIALPDILKAMIEDGSPYTLRDWPDFFNTRVSLYPSHFVQNFPFHSSEVVEVITQAGGTAVFAHPARIGEDDIREMNILLPHGLGGVEVYYPYHDRWLTERYETFAMKNDLIQTGGTDWHGPELTTWNVEIGDYGINDIIQTGL